MSGTLSLKQNKEMIDGMESRVTSLEESNVIGEELKTSLGNNTDVPSATGSVHAKLKDVKTTVTDIPTMNNNLGSNSDAASATGSVHAKLKDIKENLISNSGSNESTRARIWTTPGTYSFTVPDGIELIFVTMVGAGGGGGGGNGGGHTGAGPGGGGGASASFIERMPFKVNPNSTHTVTVGKGGNGGAGGTGTTGYYGNQGYNGTSGGITSVGSLVSISGGNLGYAPPANSNASGGGATGGYTPSKHYGNQGLGGQTGGTTSNASYSTGGYGGAGGQSYDVIFTNSGAGGRGGAGGSSGSSGANLAGNSGIAGTNGGNGAVMIEW